MRITPLKNYRPHFSCAEELPFKWWITLWETEVIHAEQLPASKNHTTRAKTTSYVTSLKVIHAEQLPDGTLNNYRTKFPKPSTRSANAYATVKNVSPPCILFFLYLSLIVSSKFLWATETPRRLLGLCPAGSNPAACGRPLPASPGLCPRRFAAHPSK